MRQNGELRSPRPVGDLRVGRLFCAALLALAGAYAVETVSGIHGSVDRFFDNWVYNGLLLAACACCLARAVLVRAERLPWLLMSCGLLLWTTGDLYYYFFLSASETVPVPSVADPFYLAFYPVSYVALALLLSARMRKFQENLWLDGLIAALAVAALGTAVIYDKVLSTTGGPSLVVATNLAYPLADLLLLSLIVAMFALTGWRFDGTWAFVAAGYAVFAVADSIYLYQTAVDRYVGLRRLATGDEARGRSRRELAGADAAHVFRADRALAARLRPLRADEHAFGRTGLGRDRNGDRARRPHFPRAGRAACGQPRGSIVRRTDRARQPEEVHGRPGR